MSATYWGIVFGLVLLGEIVALIKHEGTLTEYVRRFFGVKGRPLKWQAPKAAMAAFLIWLLGHFFGWWGGL